MKKEITKNDVEWEIFGAIWKYYLKFAEPEKKKEYAKQLLEEGADLVKKFNDHPLAGNLVLAVQRSILNGKGEQK